MGMTIDKAKNKMDFLKKAYQKLIDEKVDSGKLVGDGVSGEWKAETPLDEAYKDIIEALDLAIKALEQTRPKGKWKILDECANEGVYCSECHKKVFKLEFSHTMKWRNFKYCPNCGAKMEVEE